MNTVRFDSVMIKFAPQIKKEDVFVMFQLKVTEDSTVRGLPQQFKKQIDLGNVFSTAANQDVWDKVNIPLGEYRMKYKIEFADQTFDFSSRQGISTIIGVNNDIPGAANAAGKSSLFSALFFVLFGKEAY